jgi:hypothetical protein
VTTTLTPPADAPLPWSMDGGHNDGAVRDATGRLLMRGWYTVDLPAMAYLVACANAAPGLVAERDVAVTEAKIRHLALLVAIEKRDTALARVAALEQEVARLRTALSDAVDLAAEGISYTEPYFRTKWEMVERLAAISAVAAMSQETP